MKLVDKIKYMMNKLNIKNISQLSKIAHIPYTTIKDIFNKDTLDIKLSTSKKLCKCFNLTLDELLDDNTDLPDFNVKTININKLETEDQIKKVNEYIDFITSKK